ncbi:DUF2867 domain-containing protein [Rhizobium sp. C4]|uniref:DUF2867 domain-containing protein n=1 Tax=Rhizobium sp. C4 TaxID=1349800 RepID=UPI001E58A4C3|nr:DUF2867 domain-containing protein [Rhizobium sp. C4]MCD2175459.1 DUF2867 domain-containing protein [Rhizobium sp. C4]
MPPIELPGADWVDRHHVLVSGRDVAAPDAARSMLGAEMPGWVSSLMRLRNFIVGFVGLKGAGPGVGLDPSHSIGGFPIVSETPRKVVLGFDDWHLDFRIVVEATPQPAGTEVSVSTLVKRKHWFGKAYIFLITPFHMLIVKQSMKRLGTPVS